MKSHRNGFLFRMLLPCLVLLALSAGTAEAGRLYQLEFTWRGALPTLPADIELRVYDNSDDLKGTSTVTYDGSDLSNFVHDDIAFITGVGIEGGELFVYFVGSGHHNGHFHANSAFEILVNGVSSFLELHTSCSQPLDLNVEYPGDPAGGFTITGGTGSCIPGDPDCPPGDKLYELNGFFELPLAGCTPGAIVFNAYKDTDDLKGTGTATWNGSGLSGIVCDDVACLVDAEMDGENLIVYYEVFGWKNDGEFDANISLEIDLGACGTFILGFHASCSQPIVLDTPYGIPGGGSMTLTGGCGACLVDQPVSTESRTWSAVKSLY
ncbi:MAG: hypothetical protein GY835_00615 [bacterium]|nr:hypothetical protein [bacterium]